MEHKKILIDHENAPEGGYGIESFWAIPLGDNKYKIDNILFYADNYSWGDIVSVEDRNGELYVNGLIEESGHSTIRIIFYNIEDVQKTRLLFENMGCDSEGSNIPELIAFDIPASINYTEIKKILDEGVKLNKWGYEEACLAHKD